MEGFSGVEVRALRRPLEIFQTILGKPLVFMELVFCEQGHCHARTGFGPWSK